MLKKYSGFTLVEMLIVMGIIILLMALGIGGGRLALQNAANIGFKGAVKQMNEAALAYYSAKGSFPAQANPATLLGSTGVLQPYSESFDGGNDTTYFYITEANHQKMLFCVELSASLNGTKDLYCEGNGFNALPNTTNPITTGTTVAGSASIAALNAVGPQARSLWTNKNFGRIVNLGVI